MKEYHLCAYCCRRDRGICPPARTLVTHVAGYWPYLLLLVCPLMHLFSTATEGMEIINITEVKTIKN